MPYNGRPRPVLVLSAAFPLGLGSHAAVFTAVTSVAPLVLSIAFRRAKLIRDVCFIDLLFQLFKSYKTDPFTESKKVTFFISTKNSSMIITLS